MLELTLEKILILLISLAIICAIGIPLILQALKVVADFLKFSVL
ncbi:MAG: hypothetical protein ACTSRP_06795 [Candidatus Helarchaeota archaeon]